MRVLLVLIVSAWLVACSNDSEPGRYPYVIPEGEVVVVHTWNQDSLSIANTKRYASGRLGRSLVNEVKGFGPEEMYIAYEPNGYAAMAYESDNAWIALPTTQGVFVPNEPRASASLMTESARIESVSRCVQSAGPSTSAIIAIESTLRTFAFDGTEIWSVSWTDSVWWSRKHGAISKMKYRFYTHPVKEWEMRCEFPDGFIEVD